MKRIFWLQRREAAVVQIQAQFRRFRAYETRIIRVLLAELRDVARNAYYHEIIATYRIGCVSPRVIDSITVFTADDPIDAIAVGEAEILAETEGDYVPTRFIGQLWCDDKTAVIEITRTGRSGTGASVVCNQTYARRVRKGRVTLRRRKRRMGPELLNIPFWAH